MQVIKKIDVGSAARVYGLTLGILGILIGIIYSLMFGWLSTFLDTESGLPPFVAPGIGMLTSLIFMPIIYGIIGFVFGAVGAVVYNFVAKKFGGLEVEISSLTSPVKE